MYASMRATLRPVRGVAMRQALGTSRVVAQPHQQCGRVFYSATKQVSKPSSLPTSLAVSLGGAAGAVSALAGVGGGLLLIPTLARFSSLPMQAVNGTALSALTLSALVGAGNYAEAGAFNAPMVLMTSIPSIMFARLGVQAAHRVSSKQLSRFAGWVMLTAAPFVALKGTKHSPGALLAYMHGDVMGKPEMNPLDIQQHYSCAVKGGDDNVTMKLDSSEGVNTTSTSVLDHIQNNPVGFLQANSRYAVAGAAAGFLSGLCGIGGGMLTTAYLTTATDMPQPVIVGTTLGAIIPTALASSYYNFKAKSIHLPTAFRLGGALVVGTYVSSKYVLETGIPEEALRSVLGVALGVAAMAMIRRPL